ncbi:MAG: YciI family protein [Bauldia sp.]
MAKYMAIYLAPAAAMAQMMQATPEQMKAGMAEWTQWSDDNDEVIDDLGGPLGKTKRISGAGVADTKNELTGYTIVEADSFEEAAKLFEDHPHLKMGEGAVIDLLEVMSMDDMMEDDEEEDEEA